MRITGDTPVRNLFCSTDTELYHHGVEGQRWGVRRYQNEDGTLTKEGIARLRGYDGDESDWVNEHASNAISYVQSWERKYGSAPMNRLRFEYNGDEVSNGVSRGKSWCSEYDWNRTSLDDIFDAYNDYRESREWD